MNNQQKIKETILEIAEKESFKKDIQKISLFGSYAENQERPDSDIDILIEFKPSAKIGLFRFSEIRELLSRALNKEVDLLTPDSISTHLKDKIIGQAKPIYEG